jgi:hypothetical protein
MRRIAGPLPTAMATAMAMCAVVAVSCLTAGCSSDREIGRSDIVGVWKSNRHGTLDFRKDGSFVASNVTLGPDCDPKSEHPSGSRTSGKGTWSVGTVSDEDPGAKMRLEPGDGPVRSCTVWTTFGNVDPPSDMYFTHDSGTAERYRRD